MTRTAAPWSQAVQPATVAQLRKGPPVVNVETAAALFGIGRSTAYNLIARGEFPAKVIRVGGRFKVVTSSLLDVLDR